MKKSYLKSGLVLSYAAIFIQSAVSVIYTPVMLRLLGQSDYGLLQLAISVVSHLGILSFGFSGSYLRFYSQYKAENSQGSIAELNGIYAAVFSLASLLALAAGGIITALAGNIFLHSLSEAELSSLRVLLGIMTLNLALSLPAAVFDSYIIAFERFTFQKILVIVGALLNPMLTFPLLLMGYGSVSVAVCMTVITLLKFVLSGIFCIKRLGMRFALRRNTELAKNLFTFSFFVFLNMITDQINWNSDKTLLGILRGAESVTVYSLGAQFNTYFLTFSYALSMIFTPRAYKLAIEKRSDTLLSEFFSRFGRLQLSVMAYIFLILIAVGKPFIRIWSGMDTDIPYYTAIILISPLLVTSAQSIGIEIQRAKDMHRFRSLLYLVIAFINILISIPLCIKFGEIGCAAGTFICMLIGHIVIMNFYYHKRVGLDMAYFWRGILRLLPVLAPSVLCAYVLNRLVMQNIFYIAAGVIILTAVYVPSIWFLGVRNDVRELL